ncbi:HNH endonuclease [Salmonella enterica]|nr:HNH endonuclease [Salmonella enterica]
MAIQFNNGDYRYEITRASYTRQVWKRNHMAWGRPTPGCWNTVHCGKRDSSYSLYHKMATNKAVEITGLTAPEFQFLFEALDAKNGWIYIEGNELRFYMSGKWHTFNKGKDSNIRDVLKKLELLGNADAERVKAKQASQKAAVSTKAAKRAKAVALTQSLGLMAESAPAAPQPDPVVEEAPTIWPYAVYEIYVRFGVPEYRLDEFHEWYRVRTGHFSGVKLRQVVLTWLAIHTVGPVPKIVAVEAPAVEVAAVEAPAVEDTRIDMRHTNKSGIRFVGENVSQQKWGYSFSKVGFLRLTRIELDDSLFQEARGWHQAMRWGTREEAADALFALVKELTGRECYLSEAPAPTGKAPRKRKKRDLVEDREHREDVAFYGRRRRDQGLFHADVAQNCGHRCVYTLASELRCDAAHLVPHARKGGASFKNGILLRKDLHVLMDANHCGIDPQDLTIWFTAEILASDPDLAALNGRPMRPTDKPIRRENLAARWDAFLEVYMA